jgi:transposase
VIQAFSMVAASRFCYALAMSAAVIPDPDRDAQIAALTAALATAKAELAARDLLIETLGVQIARMRRMAFGA